MADISKVKVGTTNYNVKDTTARSGVSGATTNSYSITLAQGGWSGSGSGPFTYTQALTSLRASHAPLITCTDNDKTNYSNITSAEATQAVGIVFTASAVPSSDIHLIVIDLG